MPLFRRNRPSSDVGNVDKAPAQKIDFPPLDREAQARLLAEAGELHRERSRQARYVWIGALSGLGAASGFLFTRHLRNPTASEDPVRSQLREIEKRTR